MTTANASKQATDFNATFEAAADRVRALNEQMIAEAKKNGTASIDAYEKSLKTLVEFQKKAADATKLDWVNTVVQAQTDFISEVSAAYTTAAREALK